MCSCVLVSGIRHTGANLDMLQNLGAIKALGISFLSPLSPYYRLMMVQRGPGSSFIPIIPLAMYVMQKKNIYIFGEVVPTAGQIQHSKCSITQGPDRSIGEGG